MDDIFLFLDKNGYFRNTKGPKMEKGKQWYAIYTAPRAEKRVQERLNGLGVECWLPLHRSPRVWSDRIKIVEVPLFSSYLFVHCLEPELRPLLKVNGVSKIVYYDGAPAIVREKEIDAIRKFLSKAAENVLCPGDEVEVICGTLKNISGKIQRIKRNYLALFLEQLGATVCVKLNTVKKKNASL